MTCWIAFPCHLVLEGVLVLELELHPTMDVLAELGSANWVAVWVFNSTQTKLPLQGPGGADLRVAAELALNGWMHLLNHLLP